MDKLSVSRFVRYAIVEELCALKVRGPYGQRLSHILPLLDGASLAAELDKLISNATSIEDVDVRVRHDLFIYGTV